MKFMRARDTRSVVFSTQAIIVLCLLASNLLSVMPAQSKPPASGAGSTWVLTQKSSYAGTMETIVSSDAIKMTSDKMGLIFLLKAPGWDCFVYNTGNKNYIKLPYDQWKKKLIFSSKKGKFDNPDEFKPGTLKTNDKLLGQPTSKFVVKRLADNRLVAQVWVVETIQAPKQFIELMQRLLGNMPMGGKGTPLKAVLLQENRVTGQEKDMVALETLKMAKQSVAANVFTPLAGYRLVKDEMALMMDDGESSMGGGFMGDTVPRGR